ncbi:MAG: N5-glutamine methyltransferase family protein [Candidatus Dormibacteria bacterium]
MRVGDVLRSAAAALAEAGCISNSGEAELAIRRLTTADPMDPESVVNPSELDAVEAYVERRRTGDPPQYILGGCEFMQRWIRLDETAYVPRPWTETMVLHGVNRLKGESRRQLVVDVGTGSGAIAAVIAGSVEDVKVWALDIDPRALRWAEINNHTATNVTVLRSDLFEALPEALAGEVDLVIGSLPYVPSGELINLPRDYREHEPAVALDGGQDGLSLDRRAIRDALPWLRPGGRVLLELGHRQGRPLVAEARRLGYAGVMAHVDEEGDDLFVECER